MNSFIPPHTLLPGTATDDIYPLLNDNFFTLWHGISGYLPLPLAPQGSNAVGSLGAGATSTFYNGIYGLQTTSAPALVVNNYTVYVDSPGFNSDPTLRYPDGPALTAGQKKLFMTTSTSTTGISVSGNDPVYQLPDGTISFTNDPGTTGPYYPIAYQLVSITNLDSISHNYAIHYGLQAFSKTQTIFR